MLVYNTVPDEQALEMTATDMDVPLPSAMINFSDAMLLKRELARRPDGVLVMRARPEQSPQQQQGSGGGGVVDMAALTRLLEDYFMQQNNCEDEDCLRFVNPGTCASQSICTPTRMRIRHELLFLRCSSSSHPSLSLSLWCVCVVCVSTVLPIVIDSHAIPRRPAGEEEAESEMVPPAQKLDNMDELLL
jgi:hypothetical protein